VLEPGSWSKREAALERFDDLGRGHEVAERREVGEAAEPEPFEEAARGAVEDGEAGPGSRPTSSTYPRCTSVASVDSTLTPRIAEIWPRVIGCL
jgi:hypothetical protein